MDTGRRSAKTAPFLARTSWPNRGKAVATLTNNSVMLCCYTDVLVLRFSSWPLVERFARLVKQGLVVPPAIENPTNSHGIGRHLEGYRHAALEGDEA
jgi:hypothetical protein